MTEEVLYDEDLAVDTGIETVAIVGYAGRFPSASSVDRLWENLLSGEDGMHWFSDAELEAIGISPDIYRQNNFVPRGTRIEAFDEFDAVRFGFSPREAANTDPQSRLLLEICHQALEHAGYPPFQTPGEVGVFAGCNPVDYAHLLGPVDYTDSASAFDRMIGNDRDFLATRVSHRLNLTGPALNVQSACSTSLVAVHLAAQHLLEYQCSLALAGGVSLNFRQGVGYFYQPGMILSPDGYCRAFDAKANGTTLGQGAGVVVLKRLSDALVDGDTIHAVLTGSAINNDGARKVSYTAPSVEGQARVIAAAQAVAGVQSQDITYIEAHGTGTLLGDPIEVAALTQAFALSGEDDVPRGYCGIGSIKTNIGHLDAAAGIAGFLKAVLAVRDGQIPKSLHYDQPNPDIPFEDSPFYVADETRTWSPGTTDKRRAGVSSMGIGGTNAHVIVEEPPAHRTVPATHRPLIAIASAPTSKSADLTIDEVEEWAKAGRIGAGEVRTLTAGRSLHLHRRALTLDERGGVSAPKRAAEARPDVPVLWMFSGQGAQFPGMARCLYGHTHAFTEELDHLCNRFAELIERDLIALLTAPFDDADSEAELRQTAITQPALFAVQCAMARQLQDWGMEPRAVLGHSIGEFAAAVVAGIFDREDACVAVAARGRLMQAMAPGGMVAVQTDAATLSPLLPAGVELAAMNSTQATVAAGPLEALSLLEENLTHEGQTFTRLRTSHGFHSAAMVPAALDFETVLADLHLHPPSVPLLSARTGNWITDSEAVSPGFWASQIRDPVRFTDCLSRVAEDNAIFVELGPGQALSSFAQAHTGFEQRPIAIPVLTSPRGPDTEKSPFSRCLDSMARLWTEGVEIDLERVNNTKAVAGRPAPLSVLDHSRHWAPSINHLLSRSGPVADNTAPVPVQIEAIDRWCYARSWRLSPSNRKPVGRVLALTSGSAACERLLQALRRENDDVLEVRIATVSDPEATPYRLAPIDDDFQVLADQLNAQNRLPELIVHAWNLDTPEETDTVAQNSAALERGVESLLSIARAFGPLSRTQPIHLSAVVTSAFNVTGDEQVLPAHAAMSGPVKVIPLEINGMTTRLIDVPDNPNHRVLDTAASEAQPTEDDEPVAAVRGNRRWVHTVSPIVTRLSDVDFPIRNGGVYLIVGGTGGVGLSIARYLAVEHGAKVAITSRSGPPAVDATDPEARQRLDLLEEIAKAAPAFLHTTADATDPSQMKAALTRVEQEVGPLNGVIFVAAVVDTAGGIRRRSRAASHAVVAAKIDGTLALAEALGERALDFIVLSSSIATQLFHNRFGQVGYVTANAFSEAVAESGLLKATRVLTIAWDDWLDVGMSVKAAQNFSAEHGASVTLMDQIHSFSPEQGIETFIRALTTTEPTVYVSTTRLDRRIEADIHVVNPFLEQAAAVDQDTDLPVTTDGPLDDIVRDIWRSLIGVDEIGTDDDFFDLGGDSLQAARMGTLISRHVGYEVSVDTILENPKFSDLIPAVQTLSSATGAPTEFAKAGEIPLTPPQRRFLERTSIDPSLFNLSVILKPHESLDDSTWQQAIDGLIGHYDALRTRFTACDGTAMQLLESDGSRTVALGHTHARTQENFSTLLPAIQSQIDIVDGPLAIFHRFSFDNGTERVLISLHHLISDRLSLLSLIDELDHRLVSDANRNPATPYSAWTARIEEFVHSKEATRLVRRWDELVHSKSPDFILPGSGVTPLNRNADAVTLELSSEISTALLTPADGNPSIQETLIAALGEGLRNCWAQERTDVGIDVLGHGRRHFPGLDDSATCGYFLSWSPVWLPPGASVRTLADSVRGDLEWAWTFDFLRFGRPSPGTQRDRPEVLFNYVGRPIKSANARKLETSEENPGPTVHPDNPREYRLAVRAGIDDTGHVSVTFVYDTSVFSADEIGRLADCMRVAVHDALEGN